MVCPQPNGGSTPGRAVRGGAQSRHGHPTWRANPGRAESATTNSLEIAIASAANSGLRRPVTAMGIAIPLHDDARRPLGRTGGRTRHFDPSPDCPGILRADAQCHPIGPGHRWRTRRHYPLGGVAGSPPSASPGIPGDSGATLVIHLLGRPSNPARFCGVADVTAGDAGLLRSPDFAECEQVLRL